MGRKRKTILNLEVTGIAAEGKGVGRKDGCVVFVKSALPGDVVDVKIIKKKSNYSEGIVSKFHKYSEDRIKPFCEHFNECGGCKWQNLPYEKQLTYKQQQIEEQFKRLGHLTWNKFYPIFPSTRQTLYRNKLEFTFSAKRWITIKEAENAAPIKDNRALGFHVRGLWDKVLDINKCYLQDEYSNTIRDKVRHIAKEQDLTFYDLYEKKGFLRNIVIRNSPSGEWMLLVCFGEDNARLRQKFLTAVAIALEKVITICYIINTKQNDSYADLDVHTFNGEGYINIALGSLLFKISPKSFFQTNTFQAIALYNKVQDLAELKGDEILYDLYTGTGSIACYLANNVKKAVGLEIVQEAIADAKDNAKRNHLKNCRFYAGDMKKLFSNAIIEKEGSPDIVIADPPRAGMDKEVIEEILRIAPPKIIYVSCNPASQARDLALLCEKYTIDVVQPLDMFPHTHHVENIVTLHLHQ